MGVHITKKISLGFLCSIELVHKADSHQKRTANK